MFGDGLFGLYGAGAAAFAFLMLLVLLWMYAQRILERLERRYGEDFIENLAADLMSGRLWVILQRPPLVWRFLLEVMTGTLNTLLTVLLAGVAYFAVRSLVDETAGLALGLGVALLVTLWQNREAHTRGAFVRATLKGAILGGLAFLLAGMLFGDLPGLLVGLWVFHIEAMHINVTRAIREIRYEVAGVGYPPT
jgi:hypothetical protein